MLSLLICNASHLDLSQASKFTDLLLLRFPVELANQELPQVRLWAVEWLLSDEQRVKAEESAVDAINRLVTTRIKPFDTNIIELMAYRNTSLWWGTEVNFLHLLEDFYMAQSVVRVLTEKYDKIVWWGPIPQPWEFNEEYVAFSGKIVFYELLKRNLINISYVNAASDIIQESKAYSMKLSAYLQQKVNNSETLILDWLSRKINEIGSDESKIIIIATTGHFKTTKDEISGRTYYEPSYLEGLIPELERRQLRYKVIATGGLIASERNLPAVFKRWTEFIQLKPYILLSNYVQDEHKRCAAEVRQRIENWAKVSELQDWCHQADVPDILQPQMKRLWDTLPAQSYRLAQEYETMREALARERATVMLHWTDMMPIGRMYNAAARDIGVESVGIMHGSNNFAHFIYYKISGLLHASYLAEELPIPDKTLVYGRFYREQFLKSLKYPEKSIIIVGLNRTDAMLQKKAHKQGINVLIATSSLRYFWGSTSSLKYLDVLTKYKSKIDKIWLKPHHRVLPNELKQHRKLAHRINMQVGSDWIKVVPVRADLSELIAQSEIVICGNPSTLLHEALVTGCFCIQIQVETGVPFSSYRYPTIEHPNFRVVSSRSAFEEAIAAYFQRGSNNLSNLSKYDLNEYFAADGQVNKRIADVLERKP